MTKTDEAHRLGYEAGARAGGVDSDSIITEDTVDVMMRAFLDSGIRELRRDVERAFQRGFIDGWFEATEVGYELSK